MKKRFPTVAVLLFVIAIIWLLNDLNVVAINIPWIPIVLIVISLGWMINRYTFD